MVDLSKFGKKHECGACGTKFYDMNKPKPICPKCGGVPAKGKPKAKKAVIEDDKYDAPEVGDLLEGEDPEVHEDLDMDMDMEMDFGVLDENDTQGLPHLPEEDTEEEEEDPNGGSFEA